MHYVHPNILCLNIILFIYCNFMQFQSHHQIISHSGQVHLQNCLSSPPQLPRINFHHPLRRLQSSVLPPGTGLEKSVAAAAWHAHRKGMMAPRSKGAQSQTKVQIPPGAFSSKTSPTKFEGGNKGCWECYDVRSCSGASASLWEQLKNWKQ